MSSSATTFESPSNSPPPSTAAGAPLLTSSPDYFPFSGGFSATDQLLDSPVLLSSSRILLSPTTGSFPLNEFNWKLNDQIQEQDFELNNFSDLLFQTQSAPATEIYHQPTFENAANLVKTEHPFPSSKSNSIDDINNYNHQSKNKKLDDGYNWRKYGQKLVKASENPRSYYKCTYRNCSMRKKLETSIDGDITQIVYKGNHNHPKPKRSSSSSITDDSRVVHQFNDFPDQSIGSGQWESVGTPENSSISLGDDEFDHMRSGGDEFVEDEAHAKRLKTESENEGLSINGSNTVREPRVVIQTISDIDVLDDGYRWRKYGQKVVKGNSNPRSYYKCTTPGCSVRKHIERASHDIKSVITTYEGRHKHDLPAARGVRSSQAINLGNNVSTMTINQPELSYQHPSNSVISSSHDSKLPLQNTKFTLEMVQGQGGFGFAGFENPVRSTYMNRELKLEDVFSKAKDEPKDDSFFESLLY